MSETPVDETPAGETPAGETPEAETPAAGETTEPTDVSGTAEPGMPVTGVIDCLEAQPGDTITMLYQWSGVEETKLNTVLRPLVDACGVVIEPESTRDQALLDTRVQAGTPPDIAFWNVAQLVQYQDQLQPMDEIGAQASNYPDFFVEQGTVDGKWVGLPVKSDIKSIIWYSPVVFEAKGYTVPTTWEELDALVEQMVANGDVPWSMGFESGDATGWAGSDFIQDILLVTQGPDYVMGIISGEVPYDDAGVREVYEIYGKWAMDPAYTFGGATGTLSTPFLDAIYAPFNDPPDAMMVKQSGFAGAEIAGQFPDLEFGTDYDFFQIPGVQGVQGGADWMMSFSDTPAVQALVTYLSSPLGGQNWAAAGFDLSPNVGAQGNYTDPGLEKRGEILANAEAFTPDIGDSIPGGFGKAEWTAIVNFVNGSSLDQELPAVVQAQSEAIPQ
jgi:alpha-glucoside transport system substrate-binding protein